MEIAPDVSWCLSDKHAIRGGSLSRKIRLAQQLGGGGGERGTHRRGTDRPRRSGRRRHADGEEVTV